MNPKYHYQVEGREGVGVSLTEVDFWTFLLGVFVEPAVHYSLSFSFSPDLHSFHLAFEELVAVELFFSLSAVPYELWHKAALLSCLLEFLQQH